MATNKVVYGNTTLIDLTDSTLSSADQILSGTTAYDRSGVLRSGTAQVGTKVYDGDYTSDPVYSELFMETVVSGVTDALLNTFYPVGSIYMSVNSTNPSTMFGGTWQQLEDRFLLGAGSTYTAGATGGEAAHTLTINEMPSHSHATYYQDNSGSLSWGFNYANKGKQSSTDASGSGVVNRGGGQAHNNLPPYLVVYMWQRTA